MSLLAGGATHRGAPFAGRRREIGILTHLIDEGLWGRHRLVCVEAEPGMGRRRLIAEALHRGPDAEWVQLAPGGVAPDLRLWLRTELLDLLDTYPDAPLPSWALHVLARWEPRLRARAAIPALSREALPSEQAPELVGAAVGAILRALTGRTLVIVDMGLWPASGSPAERWALALSRALDVPGAVVLAARDPRTSAATDETGVRTLALEPLREPETEELVRAWTPGDTDRDFAAWLHRFTRGHPFFIHEAVRWLEELGHLRVDDDHGRVVRLDPLARLPLPFNLYAVMESRYEHLTPEAARLLHLIVRNDGLWEVERLRAVASAGDDGFEEALALLRRREFLLRRTFRRPVAAAGPLWGPLVEEAVRRRPRLRFRKPKRRRRRRAPEPVPEPVSPPPPLGQALRQLDALRRRIPAEPSEPEIDLELARIARVTRGRPGPAWDGVRGRVAVLAAMRRLDLDRPELASRWIRWGLAHLSPDIHPGLRRALGRLHVRAADRLGEHASIPGILGEMRREATTAGHLVAAARVKAAEAEWLRRQGRPETARSLADRARDELSGMGLETAAELAGYTAVRARVDLRRLDEADRALDRLAPSPAVELELRELIASLRRRLPFPVATLVEEDEMPPLTGWGFGLDDDRLWRTARDRLWRAVNAFEERREEEVPRWLESLDGDLEHAGRFTDLADLHELRLWVNLEEPDGDIDGPLAGVAKALERMEPGERGRRLAHLLRTTRAVGSLVYQERFRPWLRTPAPSQPPPEPEIRLCLLGLPCVERAGTHWPSSLWPEWWARLWTEAAGAELTGSPLSIAEAERALAASGDVPDADLIVLLHTANQLLREDRTVGGGLYVEGGLVRINWSGIECDARRVLADAAAAERHEAHDDAAGAAALHERVLSEVTGAYLPGMSGERTEAARAAIRDAVGRALAATGSGGDLDGIVQRLEGPGRVVDLSRAAAGAMETAGRPRAASALRRG